jgi:type IV pilus assembly protein PilV
VKVRKLSRNGGFTLVESLVALVVLSLGLLGAWGILISSLAGHADAYRYAMATNLLRDMADRIRANPLAGARYMGAPDMSLESACDAPSACDAGRRAAADIAHFHQAAHALPDAIPLIEYEPAIGPAATDRYAITLRWRGGSDDEAVTLQLLASPVAG